MNLLLSEINSLCSLNDLNRPHWQHLNNLTCQLKDSMLIEAERSKLSQEGLLIIKNLLQQCRNCLNQDQSDNDVISCVTETYRVLRNVCVQCKVNQDLLHKQGDIFSLTKVLTETFIDLWSNSGEEKCIISLRCIVQFLGNSCAGHKGNQKLVSVKYFKSFRQLLDVPDEKLIVYTSMVVHTCLSGNLDNQEIWINEDTVDIVKAVISYTVDQDCEWGIYLIESMCKVENSFSSIFPSLTDKEKLLVLEIMQDQVKKTEPDQRPANSNLLHLSDDVKSQAYKILSLLASHDDQNPVVIVKEIEILGIATSNHTLYPEINTDKDLLTSVIYLLDAIHKIGKQGDNFFSRIDKVADSTNIDTQHAGYGLKRDIISLIGNMAYKCKPNQDLIRELNCIPLVLDQTNIDGRNPYITQWSVLAIHNICMDNNENKAVLASLKFNGLADDADILRKYGIEAEVKDNKVVVKSPSDRTQ